MKKIILTLAFLVAATAAHAQVVIPVDVTGWDQFQRNMIKAASYRIAFEAGEDVVPDRQRTGPDEITLTFSALTAPTQALINPTNILNMVGTIQSENAAAAAADDANINALRQGIRDKLNGPVKVDPWTVDEINYLLRAIGLMQ